MTLRMRAGAPPVSYPAVLSSYLVGVRLGFAR